MKKIEMMNKIEEIVENTVKLLKQINIEEDSFRKVFNDFRDNKSDEWRNSDNFSNVMHYSRFNDNFVSALEFELSYDREHMEDITAYELKDDLKAVKNFYKFVKNFVENHPELVEQYEKEKEEMYAKWRKEDEETYDKFDKSFSDEDIEEATFVVNHIYDKLLKCSPYVDYDDQDILRIIAKGKTTFGKFYNDDLFTTLGTSRRYEANEVRKCYVKELIIKLRKFMSLYEDNNFTYDRFECLIEACNKVNDIIRVDTSNRIIVDK